MPQLYANACNASTVLLLFYLYFKIWQEVSYSTTAAELQVQSPKGSCVILRWQKRLLKRACKPFLPFHKLEASFWNQIL